MQQQNGQQDTVDTAQLGIFTPTRKIDFQHDTLDSQREDDGFVLAYFSSGKNTVTVNIREGKNNEYNKTLAMKAHEQKHRDNQANRMYDYDMSLEQNYKQCCVDEISTNICELLQWREQYINAKDEAERQAIVNHSGIEKFNYYFKAVKEGKINPFSNNPKDLENEMRFIGQETQKMWMHGYAQSYDKYHRSMSEYWFNSHQILLTKFCENDIMIL